MASTPPALRESAVLVPAFRRADGDVRILLVRRGEQGAHGGQLGFPGGKCEPADSSPLETALREAREEVGLAREEIEVIAHLPPVETLTTGFRIVPFLARVTPPARWQCQDGEIAEIFEMKVRDLSRSEARGEDAVRLATSGEPLPIAFFRVGPYRLWGASFRILEPLLPRLVAGEWTI
ncbi:MAG TPA: CoA pyrophosphatase [Opitutaceae bacterium]|nr:CoA pyrophosphatase [Opitutaceae bacterium]